MYLLVGPYRQTATWEAI